MNDTSSYPSNWASCRLGDVVTQGDAKAQPGERGCPDNYIGMDDIESESGRLLGSSSSASVKSGGRVAAQGDVVFGRLRPYLNKVAMPQSKVLCSGELLVLKAADGVAPSFIAYLLRSPEAVEFAVQESRGDRPRVYWDSLAELEVRLPPVGEQQRIVAEIERRLSHVDAAEQALSVVVSRVTAARRSLLRQYATGALPGGHLEHNDVLDLPLPATWTTSTVAELVAEDRKSAYGVLKPGDHVSGGVPFVRVGDIANGSVDPTNLKRIDPDIAAGYPRTRLHGGELLVSIVGTIGRTGVAPAELAGANVARAVAVIPVDEKRTRAGFLSLVLEASPFHQQLVGSSNEVARKTLNLGALRDFRVPVPPVEEQDYLLDEFSRRASLLDAAVRSAEQSIERCARLRRSILTHAFAGRLVPQDPADEPADRLLERIEAARADAAPTKRARRRPARKETLA